MAMQQLTLPGAIVKKHNALIRTKINLDNKHSARILASLIACIRTDDEDFAEAYRIQAKNLLPDTGGDNYRQIKAACSDLAKATAEFEVIDCNGQRFVAAPFFSFVECYNGIINAQFNNNVFMRDCLLQMQAYFTKYSLMEYLTLPSIYSQRIFEILMSWKNTEKGYEDIPVEDLHKYLNTPPSFRADFRDFRIRVLEKAHKDITTKTGLRFEWEPVKAGKRVAVIRFHFGASRRAIAEAEKKAAKEAKKRRCNNARFLRAVECAKAKGGVCVTQDNRPILCKLCLQMSLCDDVRRHAAKG